ncbi:MAG: LicD family protein [Ruminococcus flavefaciens]|jgi:lipopolysaccharide cholinephosphotransferase|nr:LicD family protein [Ruminococcus flavefaciens]
MQELSLEEKKKISFEILCNLNSICEKYNITYFLAYGSLIGAIRHKGFIPWDDDIDLWIPISQYEKFLEIVKKETDYSVLDHIHDIGWPRGFSKVSDKDTIVFHDSEKYRTKSRYGVSVDIFPLFAVKSDASWCNKILKTRNRIVYLQRYSLGVYKKNSISAICKAIASKMLIVMKKDEMYYKKKLFQLEQTASDSRQVGCIVSVYKMKDIHDIACFGETIKVEFEGKFFSAPIGYDRILRDIYGDYLKLPSIKNRVSHGAEHTFWKSEKTGLGE